MVDFRFEGQDLFHRHGSGTEEDPMIYWVSQMPLARKWSTGHFEALFKEAARPSGVKHIWIKPANPFAKKRKANTTILEHYPTAYMGFEPNKPTMVARFYRSSNDNDNDSQSLRIDPLGQESIEDDVEPLSSADASASSVPSTSMEGGTNDTENANPN